MDWIPEFTRWDMLLVGAVSAQATVMAYLHSARLKAFVFMLPIPFTCASLAVGVPVSSEHVAGLILILGFLLAIRGLYVGLRVPIVVSILLGGAGYCAAAAAIRPFLPKGAAGFWWTALVAAAVAAVAWRRMPFREEPGHRTTLPVWVKVPALAAVILALLTLKYRLAGLMVVYPFMGTIGAYEARHSLWTMSRQVPVLIAFFLPMLAAILLTQERLGMPASLAIGWAVYLAMLVPYWWLHFDRDARPNALPPRSA